MKKSTEIQAGSIARVSDKATGKLLGFLVKSNSSEEYYQVRCTHIAGEQVWTCTCKAGQMGFAGCKAGHCCHVQAVIEVAEARKAAAYRAMAKSFQVGQEQVTSRRDSQRHRFFTCTCDTFCAHNVQCEHIQSILAQAAARKLTTEQPDGHITPVEPQTVTVTSSPAHAAMIAAAEKKAAVPAQRTRKPKDALVKRAVQFAGMQSPQENGFTPPEF
jgi:hypothetical protein